MLVVPRCSFQDALLEASCSAQMLPFVVVNVFSSCFALSFSTKILKSHMPLIAPYDS